MSTSVAGQWSISDDFLSGALGLDRTQPRSTVMDWPLYAVRTFGNTIPVVVSTHNASTIAESSATVASVEQHLTRVENELDRYAEYTDQWDGYSAEPIDTKLLDEARALAQGIACALLARDESPELFTTGAAPDGSLDIELRRSGRQVFFTLYPSEPVVTTGLIEGGPRDGKPPRGSTLERWLGWLACEEDPPHPLA